MRFIPPPNGPAVNQNKAKLWAKDALSDQTAVILDTETTSFQGEIIELAIIDLEGNVLFHSCFKPVSEIDEGATAVHGLTAEKLQNCPSWGEKWEEIRKYLITRKVLIYNAKFDLDRLRYTTLLHGTDLPILVETDCIMEQYKLFTGKRQKLGGDHTAVGDCKAALAKIKEMAND